MKKLFAIILAAAVLCIEGSGTAWGQDPSKAITVGDVEYNIGLIEHAGCWFNDYFNSTEKGKNNGSNSITIRVTAKKAGSPSGNKQLRVVLENAFDNITYDDISITDDTARITVDPSDLSSQTSQIYDIKADLLFASTNECKAILILPDNQEITIEATIINAHFPEFNHGIRPNVPPLHTYTYSEAGEATDPNTPTIEVIDSLPSRGGWMSFAPEEDNVDTLVYTSGFYDSDNKVKIGWLKASPLSSNFIAPFPDFTEIKSLGFKALKNPLDYRYEYKYLTKDGCDIDTTLSIAVWIKKDYKPQLTPRGNNDVVRKSSRTLPAGDPDGCFYQLSIENLPYIKDITDAGGTEIDTIQTDRVYVEVLKKNEHGDFVAISEVLEEYEPDYIPEFYDYSEEWINSTHQEPIVLKGGNTYQIKYTYKYIHAQSPKNDSVFIYETELPHAFKVKNDSATVTTNTSKGIYLLTNDTISRCLSNDNFWLEVKASNGTYYHLDANDGKYYDKDGNSTPTEWHDTIRTTNGFVLIKNSDGTKRGTYIEYISNKDYMGYETIRYRLQDIGASTLSVADDAGEAFANLGEVYLRVNPSYKLEASKRVTHIGSHKGDRRTTNLDTVFTGDTVYFEVKVKNTGKNSITQAFSVRDTFPKSMRFPLSDGGGTALLDEAMPDFASISGNLTTLGCYWQITPAEIGVDDSVTKTFGLIARGSTSLLDTNKLHVEANTLKFPGEGDTTLYCRDTLPLDILENVDVKLTKKVLNTANIPTPVVVTNMDSVIMSRVMNRGGWGNNTPISDANFIDSLNVDSLGQTVYFVLEARNVGTVPLSNIEIRDSLPEGLDFVADTAHLFNNNSKTSVSIDVSLTPENGWLVWRFTNRIGPDSAIRLIIVATDTAVGKFRNFASAKDLVKINDVDSADNCDTAMVVFEPKVNLTVEKTVAKYNTHPLTTTVAQGDTVVYTIRVTNNSDKYLNHVQVKDTISSKLKLLCDSVTGYTDMSDTAALDAKGRVEWYLTDNDTSFIWTIPAMKVGDTEVLRFYAMAVGETKGDAVVNVAHAYVDFYEPDSVWDNLHDGNVNGGGEPINPDDNELTIEEGLELSLTAVLDSSKRMIRNDLDPARLNSYRQGDTATVLLIVQNLSPNDKTSSLTVQLQLPSDTLLFCASPDATYNHADMQWELPYNASFPLEKGKTDTLHVQLIVGEEIGLMHIHNLAYLNVPPSGAENETANDTAHLDIKISKNPYNLSITKTAVRDTAFLSLDGSELLSYTITYASGDSALSGITIVDTLPKGVIIDEREVIEPSDRIKGYTADGRPILKWENLQLGKKDTAYLDVRFTVDTLGAILNTAYGWCDSLEASRRDNLSSDSVVVVSRVDLKVTLSATVKHPIPDEEKHVLEGDTIVYKLLIEHNGLPNDAEDVTVVFDPLPEKLILLEAYRGNPSHPLDARTSGAPIQAIPAFSIRAGERDSVIILARVKHDACTIPNMDSIEWRAYLSCNNDVNYNNDTSNYVRFMAIENQVDIRIQNTIIVGGNSHPNSIDFPRSVNFVKSQMTGDTVFNQYIAVSDVDFKTGIGFTLVDTLPAGMMTDSSYCSKTPTDSIPLSDGRVVLIWENQKTNFTVTVYNLSIKNTIATHRIITTVWCDTLDANPINNTLESLIKVTPGVDFVVATNLYKGSSLSPQGDGKYMQGDTVKVEINVHDMMDMHSDTIEVRADNFPGLRAIHNPDTLVYGLNFDDIYHKFSYLYFIADSMVSWSDFITLNGTVINQVNRDKSEQLPQETWSTMDRSSLDDLHFPIPITIGPGANDTAWVERGSEPLYYTHRSYTLKVTNIGQYQSDTVTLVHALPAEVRQVDSIVENTGTYTIVNDTLRWKIPTLQAFHEDTASLTLYVRLNNTDNTRRDVIRGNISCSNDYRAGRYNNFYDTLRVNRNPYDISVKKWSSDKNSDAKCDSISGVSSTIRYHIRIVNEGDSAAYNLWVTDTVPIKINSFIGSWSVAPDANLTGRHDAIDILGTDGIPKDTVIWFIDTLPAGDTLTLTYEAEATEAGMYINTAQARVDTSNGNFFDEDDFDNNVSVDTIEVYSTQTIRLNVATYKIPSSPLHDTNTFTQGDTVMFRIAVQGRNTSEISRGVKIVLDSFSSPLFAVPPVWYDPTDLNGTVTRDAQLGYVWKMDSIKAGAGEMATLRVWAIVGNEIPLKGLIDSFTMHIRVDTFHTKAGGKYYGSLLTSNPDSAEIYLTYCPFDISVRKEALSSPVTADMTFGYKIIVTNERDSATKNLRLVDRLPKGVAWSNATIAPEPDSSYYDNVQGDTILVWNNIITRYDIAELAPSKSLQVTIYGLSGSQSTPHNYINHAQIFSDRHEASLRNNSDTANVRVVGNSDVEFTFTPKMSTIKEGDELTLTLAVTNKARAEIADLQIDTIRLPKQLRLVSSSPELDDINDSTYWWQYEGAALLTNEGDTITLRVVAADTGTAVSWAQLLTHGKNPQKDSVTVRITPRPYNLKVTKRVRGTLTGDTVFWQSDAAPYEFEYEITVENTRDSVLTGIQIVDVLPKYVELSPLVEFAWQLADDTIVSQNADSVTFILNSPLQPGESQTYIIPCAITDNDGAKEYVNRVIAWCSDTEADLSDNIDSAVVAVRRDVNLKVAIMLCATTDATCANPYPANHKFRTNDRFSVWAKMHNNGRVANDTTITANVTVTPEALIQSMYYSAPLLKVGSEWEIDKDTSWKAFDVQANMSAENFEFRVDAHTTYGSGQRLPVTDTATVAGKILPGEDVKVNIIIHSAENNYDKKRSYTVHIENIGQDTAHDIRLTHKLPEELQLDSIGWYGEVWKPTDLQQEQTMLGKQRLSLGEGDTILYRVPQLVEGAKDSIVMFTTVTAPVGEEDLSILVSAKATLREDFYFGNNIDEQAITVTQSPYNLSVRIVPDKYTIDVPYYLSEVHNNPNVEAEKNQVTYDVTVKNTGVFQTYVQILRSVNENILKILEDENWSSSVQQLQNELLLSGQERQFSFKVEPKDVSSKGYSWNRVSVKSTDTTFSKYDDAANNSDSAKLTVYSWLETWPIMEAFSPNGDGKNDVFVIKDLLDNSLIKSAELVIVNRYGSEVYYHQNYQEAQLGDEGFTGTGLPEGSYFYRLTITFDGDITDKRSGFVTIRRSRWN